MARQTSIKPNEEKSMPQGQDSVTAQPDADLLTMGSDHPLGGYGVVLPPFGCPRAPCY